MSTYRFQFSRGMKTYVIEVKELDVARAVYDVAGLLGVQPNDLTLLSEEQS